MKDVETACMKDVLNCTPAYNKLHLVDGLIARTQTSFGIGQTVYFSFINGNVSIKQ